MRSLNSLDACGVLSLHQLTLGYLFCLGPDETWMVNPNDMPTLLHDEPSIGFQLLGSGV